MAAHYKPTKEELQANIDAYQAKIDELPVDPAPEDPAPVDPKPKEEITPADPKPADPEAVIEEKPVEEHVDYKKRYSDSSREAKVIQFKNKEINKAVEDAKALTDISVEEIKEEYPSYEELDDTLKQLAKDSVLNKKKLDLIHKATEKFKQVDDWNDKVTAWVTDPKVLVNNPELEGQEDAFTEFAAKPTRRGVDFDDLVLAFLGDQAKNKPAPKKGSMFPISGGGGAVAPITPDDGKISAAEGRILQKTDYKKFVELLKAKKIRNE